MPRRHDGFTGLRIGADHDAGNEERRLDPEFAEQRQDAAHTDDAELAARDQGRRRQPVRDHAAHGVEIESQAGDMAGHDALP